MSEPEQTEGTSGPSEVDKLREQFTEQFNTQKDAFETQISKLKEENASLQKHVEELQRSLVRAAVTGPAPAPVEPQKTEKQQYDEYIDSLAKSVLEKYR